MFEFTGMGLIYMGIGCAYIIYLGPKVLPSRSGLADIMGPETAGQFVTEVVVTEESVLVGRPLGELFAKDRDVTVVELIRSEEVILGPSPTMILKAQDTLLVEGTVKTIHELLQGRDFARGTAVADADRVPLSRLDLRVVEAVITPNSKFQGEEIRDLGLNRKLGINVLALRRMGQHHQYNLRDFVLRSGDVILLQGERAALSRIQEDGDVLLIEGVERSLTFPRQAPIAVGILMVVVALSAFNVAPILILSLAGVAAMLVTGCLNVAHATRALDTGVLFILAGMIPLGQAISRLGLDRMVADAVVDCAGSAGPHVLISAMYLLTTILTAFLSNNAAAVLLAPICFGIASHLQIDPRPLLVAVAFGGSASFATPIGYQTNTMVMGPGAYRFMDYVRFGGPLNLLLWIVASILIPIFWQP
jgi:di/tricarboxylate transporter